MSEGNKVTVTWGAGGPKTAEQRHAAQTLFIDALKLDPNVSLACDVAHISRKTAYQWKEKNATFSGLWDDAVVWMQDVARSSIYKRGILGWEEKVVSSGQVVYEYEPVVSSGGYQQYDEGGKPLFKGGKPLMVRKYSDSLAALYAKANLPEYKDKPQLNINAQLDDLAEKAKQDLVADIEARIVSENKKQADSTEPHS